MTEKQNGVTLEALRQKIDAADRDLLDAFDRRMAVSAEIAAWKKTNGAAVCDAGREAEKLESAARQSAYPEAAKALYQKLFTLSREYQGRLNKNE